MDTDITDSWDSRVTDSRDWNDSTAEDEASVLPMGEGGGLLMNLSVHHVTVKLKCCITGA